jgi:predicted dehydrogenase
MPALAAIAPIRLGMIGGGPGAFIGPVHRMAARLDGAFTLVAGALASDPARSIASATALGLPADRCYPDYRAMLAGETARPDGIEAVAIVTPNHLHFQPAKDFLEAGIDVICEKPVTASLAQAQELQRIVQRTGRVFVVTHNYPGYPMVREARAIVSAGGIGGLRLVQVEYAQGWLADSIEHQGSKQAGWRTDPTRAGAGGALGDIGTHAYNLAAYVTGQEPDQILADLSHFGPGRLLDDNANVLLRYASGARGSLWVSQVATGCENGLRLRIYGEHGALDWSQEDPNKLWVDRLGQPRQLLTRGGPTVAAETRLPSGHPEGFIEAFATIYADAAALMRSRRGDGPQPQGHRTATIEDGARTLAFIEACVQSDRHGASWVPLAITPLHLAT